MITVRAEPPTLEIVGCVGPVWIQDRGRPGRGGEGLPAGGALVPEWLDAVNASVGNAECAAVIEVLGELAVAARGGALLLAWGDEVFPLQRDHVRLFSGRCPGYLAVAGGIDVPVVYGGRGYLAVAGIGGTGRPLQRGDRLPVGRRPEQRGEAGRRIERGAFDPAAHIRVAPGPDHALGLGPLLATPWRIGAGDRVGMRLNGRPLTLAAEDRWPSAPMVRGAIQVPSGGLPVVLGPDYPTTGGYPVVAVVRAADHGALAARRLGDVVRFVVA